MKPDHCIGCGEQVRHPDGACRNCDGGIPRLYHLPSVWRSPLLRLRIFLGWGIG